MEVDNSRILDISKVPKSQIRENLNTRKSQDLQYITSQPFKPHNLISTLHNIFGN